MNDACFPLFCTAMNDSENNTTTYLWIIAKIIRREKDFSAKRNFFFFVILGCVKVGDNQIESSS